MRNVQGQLLSVGSVGLLYSVGAAAAFALFPALGHMQEAEAAPEETKWALEVAEKEVDWDTGRLRVLVRNTHEHETVTAFSVAAVFDSGDGRGSTHFMGKELLPGDGIAPGGVHEVTFKLRAVNEGAEDAPKYAAAKVALHFEILSDTTSHGDPAFIEETFAIRAIELQEAENALTRLRAARRDSKHALSTSEFWASFWRAESERRQEAAKFVGVTHFGPVGVEQRRQIAIHTYSELSQQFERRVAAGTALEESLDTQEWVLLEAFVQPYSAGVRPQDLEKALEEGAGEKR